MAAHTWLSELYLAHRRLMLLVAWNITADWHIAEDVVQAAIVRLALLDRPPVHPKAFALSTIRNLGLDHVRMIRRRREARLDGLHAIPSPSDENGSDTSCSPALDALAQLDPEQAETVRLHLIGEMTFREIGELLDMPLQTVASRYRRAIEKMRTIVEAQHDIG